MALLAVAAGLAVVFVPAGRAWASSVEMSSGGEGLHFGLAVMPEEGSGAYSWALPVTLSGLLKQARVNALTTEDLAALLKKQGLRDLGNGLPQKWDEAAVKAASSAGQVSKETGYVLLASWNTNDPRDKWGDDTQFWLEARLQQGDRALFDTTQRPPRYYRLAD